MKKKQNRTRGGYVIEELNGASKDEKMVNFSGGGRRTKTPAKGLTPIC